MKILAPLVQLLAASSTLETLASAVRVEGDTPSPNQHSSNQSPAPRQSLQVLHERKGGGGGKSGRPPAAGGSSGNRPSGTGSRGSVPWGICGPVSGGATTLGGYAGLYVAREAFGHDAVRPQVAGTIVGGLIGAAGGLTYCVVQEVRNTKEKPSQDQTAT